MKSKFLIFFLSTLFLCFSAHAQITRCTDPETGHVTFTDKECKSGHARSETNPMISGVGANMEGRSSTSRSTSTSTPKQITNIRGCKRRCPYNGKCLQYY